MSQTELGRRTATHQQAISRIERGLVSPSVATLERLLAALGEELVIEARPRPLLDDELARALEKSPEDRLAQSLSWNRFAGDVALAGKRAREKSR